MNPNPRSLTSFLIVPCGMKATPKKNRKAFQPVSEVNGDA
jgi:hypothetical protein